MDKGFPQKKVLSLVLCVAVMLSVMVMGAGAAFSDQDKIENTEAVDACSVLNIIGGYPDGSYKPEGNIKRSEITKMICVALNGGEEPTLGTPANPTFSDVRNTPNAAWAEKYIESCVSQGIVSGVGGGRFSPNGNVTASQLSKMLLVSLGYDSDIEGYTGNAWDMNVNVRATQVGLYKGLEGVDVSAALTRDNAAQMVWNALQAKEVKYEYTLVSENGQLVSKPTLVEKDITLLEDKYDATITTGVVTNVDYNSKGYTVQIQTGVDKTKQPIYVNLSKLTNDPTDLVGKSVKAMYKDADEVYGIYVNAENTATVVETTLGDLDLSKSEYKLDGVTYKVKTGDFGAVKAVDTLGNVLKKDSSNLEDLDAVKTDGNNFSKASKVVLIDNTGDEKIDIAVVTPVAFGEITYLNAKNITVKGVMTNAKVEDCDIYKDAAKGDRVAVVKDTYVADDSTVITKLDSVSGKVDATKDGEARIDGTWYDTAVTVKLDDKGEFFLYNGYIVGVDATGGSIADVAYLISSGTSMDVDGNYQAKVMMNGETKLVSMKGTSSVGAGDKEVYVTYEIDDGVYEFTKITAGNILNGEYTAAAVTSYKDGRIYASGKAEYLIDDDAVVYVKYNTDKYAILSGKDVAGWGDKEKTFTGSDSMVLVEEGDSMKKIQGAFINLGSDKMPASTVSYGLIVSDIVKASDNKSEFTLWNGSEQIEVVTSSNMEGIKKFQAVEYVKNSDDTYDIDAVSVYGGKCDHMAGVTSGLDQYSILSHTSNVVQLGNGNYAAKNYNITKDTQIIYVDTSASELDAICVNGGTISDAAPAKENNAYYRNASFVIDEGSDLALLIVLTNTGTTSGTIGSGDHADAHKGA